MALAFGSPEFWRKRAKEARSVADQLVDPEAKAAMLGVADSNEMLAKRAEAAPTPPPKGPGQRD